MSRINGARLAFVGSVGLAALLAGLLAWEPAAEPGRGPLLLYCAAGVKGPVEAAARAYFEECGVRIEPQYGNSSSILANAAVSRRGDLFIPADDTFIQAARSRELIDEVLPLASMRPVLAVRKGNPLKIASLNDLLAGRARIAMADPDAAAVGKLVRETLMREGRWEALRGRVTVSVPTVPEVAAGISVGSVDAGFVWDANVAQFPGLEAVPLAELLAARAAISVAILRSSGDPAAALRFARFLSARDRGQMHFAKSGFRSAGGDAWSERPELRILAGAMLRPAIEAAIAAFEEREGARVTRVYNGCGILVAQMKAGDRPDLYFACDNSFLAEVKEHFQAPREISTNQLVILVKKGNPLGVKTLRDLAKPGVRAGVGHEQQCALGALTEQALRFEKLYEAVNRNIKVRKPTGDNLVNDLRTGALDAVVVYISNAAGAGDTVEAYPVEVPCAVATQPVAVGRESRYAALAERLVDSFRTRASRERFRREGFGWKAGE